MGCYYIYDVTPMKNSACPDYWRSTSGLPPDGCWTGQTCRAMGNSQSNNRGSKNEQGTLLAAAIFALVLALGAVTASATTKTVTIRVTGMT